ncbi:hypothetical protein B7494_g189 [Chlorociboria aeruginascens]|nr:hypothetical protein B7494_g189 [Chlorociboria aeruginascens]
MGEEPSPEYIKYTTITGYFQQDDPATIPDGYDFTTTNFGLIERAYDAEFDPTHKLTQWERFANRVAIYNQESGDKVQFKVLYMGRHGEGYHNQAETLYGTKAWNCYWSMLEGDGTIEWADAHLNPTGVSQALKANAFWASQILLGIPLPQSYYTSPLDRCCATANLTFSNLPLPSSSPFIPQVKEFLREGISVHTCDRRRSKSYIAERYPEYVFEDGFEENDPLWRKNESESPSAQDERSKRLLDNIFENDSNTWISFSSHSGEIMSLLRVLGHREFSLGTGQAIAVLVKAEKVRGPEPKRVVEPWIPVEICDAPPAS